MADQISGHTPHLATARRYGNLSAAERREERRRRLLRAAVECFSRQGFSDTSIEQLCAAARVSTRTFYEEFGSREAILSELHDDLNETAFTAARRALEDCRVAGVGDVVDIVRAGLDAYFAVMTNDRARARVVLIQAVGVSRELEWRRQLAVGRFAGLVADEARALVAAGLISDRDYSLTAVGVVGAIKELVTAWAVRSTELPLDAVVDEAVRITVAVVTSDT
jgi:AcrR family transcriptional regulator